MLQPKDSAGFRPDIEDPRRDQDTGTVVHEEVDQAIAHAEAVVRRIRDELHDQLGSFDGSSLRKNPEEKE